MQTRHGHFLFANQKFVCSERGSFAFLQAADDCSSAVTQGLHSLAVAMCLRTASFEKARLALAEVTGSSLVTRQTLSNWVKTAAARFDTHLAREVAEALEKPLPLLCAAGDVYAPDAAELVVFEDGILVKAQKPPHQKPTETKRDKVCQFQQAYFALCPRPDGRFEFVLRSPAQDSRMHYKDCVRVPMDALSSS